MIERKLKCDNMARKKAKIRTMTQKQHILEQRKQILSYAIWCCENLLQTDETGHIMSSVQHNPPVWGLFQSPKSIDLIAKSLSMHMGVES